MFEEGSADDEESGDMEDSNDEELGWEFQIFGSDFWDPHWKRNSDSIFDSEDSRRKFFSNSAVEKLRNRNSDSEIRNSEKKTLRNSLYFISHK
jgi:hypothetical protein